VLEASDHLLDAEAETGHASRVCAIDATLTALLFVRRRQNRG
jgi:hypothetical protein